MTVHKLVVATHGFHLHVISFDTATAKLELVSSLKVKEQPSWVARHPKHPDIIYSNSWIEGLLYVLRLSENGELELLDTAESGGLGPTFLEVDSEGTALVAVNYVAGSICYAPLLPNGLFATATRSPNQVHAFEFPHAEVLDERQDAAHPHHLVAYKDEWLVPDLGSDIVWRMKWVGRPEDGRWVVRDKVEIDRFSGPRHAVVHPDGEHLFVLNELTSTLTATTLPQLDTSSPSTVEKHYTTTNILPPYLDGQKRVGGYDLTACEILLLPPLPNSTDPKNRYTLLVTNRNQPYDLTPSPHSGDSFATLMVDGSDPKQLSEPTWFHADGKHWRGVSVGPTTKGDEEEEKFVLMMARNGGGFAVYERQRDGGEMKELARNLLAEIEMPVGAVWMS
ncbi:hypothetical protein MNV49_005203 [Pseudohyphozyma bogoriensis]|nr:hypothetical protein MNV49_005203 [Pseudohyphozyma bogoriensis]